MNEANRVVEPDRTPADPPPPSGPNLKLIYGLIGLALLAALAFAALIVLPFYLRR